MLSFVLVYCWIRSLLYPQTDMEQKIRDAQVVPDVLPCVPPAVAEVIFSSSASMQLGNVLTCRQAKDAPVSVKYPTELGTLYTLLITDPDAPRSTDRTLGEIIHFMVVNIPGTDIHLGETYFEYLGAGTPEGTGLHRYVLSVFKQSSVLTLDIPKSRQGRVKFSTQAFSETNNLELVAANFYQAQFDESIKTQLAVKLAMAMEVDKVVPDIIDSAPKYIADVQYPSGVLVNLGGELAPTSVKDKPSVRWPTEHEALYTLLFIDPDAPSRVEPRLREILHWFIANIPGTDIEAGDTYAEYIGSGPPEDSGLHRYVLLVFKQPTGRIDYDRPKASNRSREGRYAFKTRHLIEEYNLGTPVAGNFYQAQYDDYVPILHRQLSGE